VLACAGFGDEARFAHFECEETLANNVVYLVAPGVVEILALEQQADT
jgi:hypothetical protein